MTRTPSRDVEAALLTAAEQILIEEGPSAITVRKVATCAGIAPMGVYTRFEGKQGLLEALFVRGFEGLQHTIAEAAGADARGRLRDAALRYRRYAVQNPQHYALMFERMHEVQPSEAAASSPSVSAFSPRPIGRIIAAPSAISGAASQTWVIDRSASEACIRREP